MPSRGRVAAASRWQSCGLSNPTDRRNGRGIPNEQSREGGIWGWGGRREVRAGWWVTQCCKVAKTVGASWVGELFLPSFGGWCNGHMPPTADHSGDPHSCATHRPCSCYVGALLVPTATPRRGSALPAWGPHGVPNLQNLR